jgi:hypothetical protein
MRRLKGSGITVLVLIGLLVGSGVAWAQTDEEEVTETEDLADTLFNFGYDLIHRIFLWNLTALDGVYDCTLENGPLTATYGETSDEGVVPVENLEDEGGVVSFPNRPEDEVADDLEAADAPIEYSGAAGECGLSGGDVSGPNGQVNHGMFMKLFNSLYEGKGRGCVVRHLAQSDLGKGDQQVKTGEDPDFEAVVAGDTGTIDFTTAETACEHGKKDKHEDDGGEETSIVETQNGNGNGNGKPDHAGKPDDAGKSGSHGNSGSAPGQNK